MSPKKVARTSPSVISKPDWNLLSGPARTCILSSLRTAQRSLGALRLTSREWLAAVDAWLPALHPTLALMTSEDDERPLHVDTVRERFAALVRKFTALQELHLDDASGAHVAQKVTIVCFGAPRSAHAQRPEKPQHSKNSLARSCQVAGLQPGFCTCKTGRSKLVVLAAQFASFQLHRAYFCCRCPVLGRLVSDLQP
jgi:hypothetical protein